MGSDVTISTETVDLMANVANDAHNSNIIDMLDLGNVPENANDSNIMDMLDLASSEIKENENIDMMSNIVNTENNQDMDELLGDSTSNTTVESVQQTNHILPLDELNLL